MRPRLALGLLAGILAGGLALRLWNISHGLPYVFNADEELHFVSIAVRMFENGTLNPNYFENPPAITYVFYALFKLRFGVGFPFGESSFVRDFAGDPEAAYVLARVAVALIGTLVAGLVYWAGSRFYGRRVGLLAAALLAFTFLPVFYSKHALNDVVTLAPLTVGLVGCLLVYERGRPLDWVIAGAGIGAATATKYTAGAMLVVLGVAVLIRLLDKRFTVREAVIGLAGAGAVFCAVFFLLNPFALVDAGTFRSQIGGQSGQASNAKLGQDDVPGWLYYLWTLTWGFGWVPALAAAAGGVLAFRDDRRKGLLLLAFPVFLFLFLGAQGRFFGRWLLPAYPALAILASYAAVRAVDAVAARLGSARAERDLGSAGRMVVSRRRGWLLAAAGVALVLQGVASSTRVDATLGRTDTRVLARDWLERNVPLGSRVVVEPFIPDGFLGRGGPAGEPLFDRYLIERPFQAYEKRISVDLIDEYRRDGYCWVVTGSHQKQRGLKEGLDNAEAYYARLARESSETVTISPFYASADPVEFNFDWSFNYYPRAYERPGPVVDIHRLSDCEPA
ncbi:MAG: glycosyltransferase family 39 protein [Thermoleophilaceae bacterium]